MSIQDNYGSNFHPSHDSNSINNPLHESISVIGEYQEKTVGFWMRFFAFIIDQGLVTAIIGIVVYPLFRVYDWSLTDSSYFAPITIISAIFYYGYFILMTKYVGQTLGKMIFGIKVQASTGGNLDWSTVFFRELIGRFINNTIPILYLLVIFMPKNNSVADYFADTVVIQENVYIKKQTRDTTSVEVNSQSNISPLV